MVPPAGGSVAFASYGSVFSSTIFLQLNASFPGEPSPFSTSSSSIIHDLPPSPSPNSKSNERFTYGDSLTLQCLSFALILYVFYLILLLSAIHRLQVALVIAAIINLTYTVDDGYNYNGIYLQSGLVNVSDLTCYMHGAGCSSQVTVDQLAHAYGDTTLGADSKQASDCGYFTDTASVISSTENFRYYCRRNTTVQGFAYRFNEYNPLDTQKTYPRFTNRTITAFSRECNEYPQVDGPPEKTTVGNPKSLNYISAMNFTYTNGSANQSIVIPTSALGREGTTYIFRGYHVPAEAGNFAYGDRGIWMWVYRNPGVGQDQGRFYECPVTVSAVSNVLNPKHNISDGLALEAAASIALQGQWRGNIEDPNYMQWQWYASG